MGNMIHSTRRARSQENVESVGNLDQSRDARTSISERAVYLARTVSQMSAHKGMEAAHKVGSFFGVTEQDSHMDQWKNKFQNRVKNGDVGFRVDNLIPLVNHEEQNVKQLQNSVATVSAARHEQGQAIEEFHHTVPSHPDCVIQDGYDDDISNAEKYASHESASIKLDDKMSSTNSVERDGVVYTKSKCLYLSSAVHENNSKTSSHVRFRKNVEDKYRVLSPRERSQEAGNGVAENTADSPTTEYGAVAYNEAAWSSNAQDEVEIRNSNVRFDEGSNNRFHIPGRSFLESVYYHIMPSRRASQSGVETGKAVPSKSILKDNGSIATTSCLEAVDSSPSREITSPNSSSIYSVASRHIECEPEYMYKAEGLQHYQAFVTKERIEKKTELERKKHRLERQILEEQELLEETIALTKAEEIEKTHSTETIQDEGPCVSRWKKFSNNVKKIGFNRERSRLPSGSSGKLVQDQLDEFPEYKPWFIYGISVVQVLTFLILVFIGGVTKVGLEPELQLRAQTLTFRGLETLEHWQRKNIWIGPSHTFMISAGAAFAPCMRDDIGIRVMYANYSESHNNDMTLGCCEVAPRLTAGTTTRTECENETSGVGNWTSGLLCSERNAFFHPIPHVIKPCCYGIKGQCMMTSHEHCTLLEGVFHNDDGGPEHCNQVVCLSKVCGFGGFVADTEYAYIPHNPNQWWRILLPFIYNQGFMQVIIAVAVQIIIARPIEKTAGHLRVAIIYIISGIMGLFFGSVMSPYSIQVGAGGAIFGLIGVLTVELAQSWKLIRNPWIELYKLIIVIVFFLFFGTFPFVDNFVLMAGYLYGIVLAIVVLPYITFGKWHVIRRRILILVMLPVLLMMIILEFVLFYEIQSSSQICGNRCQYINCLPYTKLVCKINELW